ncbi:hypothetical protein ACQCVH_14330 [Bacillus infantis]|uniref:hypothetical protein n=1 Tax=Bacillus infantis TaxID=324767 RepID=UPI003CEACB30
MKKLFLLLACLTGIMAGCSSSNTRTEEPKAEPAAADSAVGDEKEGSAASQEETKEDTSVYPAYDYLAEGKAEADIMAIGMEPDKAMELNKISAKMRTKMMENQEWFASYSSENMKDGEALPYHENFGITEEEYNKVLTAQDHMKLIKQGNSPVEVSRSGDKLIVKADSTENFQEIVFDLKKNTVQTPFGELPYGDEIKASDNQTVTGPWNGHVWEIDEGNVDSPGDITSMDENTAIKTVSLYTGKMEETGESLIYIRYKELKEGQVNEAEEYLLFGI